ncbi:MAG TPA: helix-turn-helix domain-containing protein [Vicinamibacterales bacterium]|jgi:transcriptional regulator with XRE-family HTH domain
MQALTETSRPAHADADGDAGASPRRTLAALPDRAQREATAALARAAYCEQLKDARERKGIRLDAIAARTKVSESLFVALERGDVSRWPSGIYRRSFFRAYAGGIGLPVDSTLDEFLRLFPDEDEPHLPIAAPAGAGALRMALVSAPRYRPSRAHLTAAFLDLAALLLVGSATTWWTGWSPLAVLASTTLLYYVVATALFGSSAGAWWLRRRAERRRFKGLRLAR